MISWLGLLKFKIAHGVKKEMLRLANLMILA